MADPLSIVGTVLAVAGLFTSAVDCFEYVQLGRSFGKDYQTFQLKLDIAELRLSRWGESVAIHDPSHARVQWTDAEAETAKKLLTQVLESFEDAKKKSCKYVLDRKSDQTALAVYEDEDVTYQGMRSRMKDIVNRRQKGASTIQKVKWALYKSKEFRYLVDTIVELVDDLVDVFPRETMLKLTSELAILDITEVADSHDSGKDSPGLKALEDAAKDVDEVFQKSVAQVQAVGTHFKGAITAEDSTKLLVGEHITDSASSKEFTIPKGLEKLTTTYGTITVKGNAQASVGRIIGGKGVFD